MTEPMHFVIEIFITILFFITVCLCMYVIGNLIFGKCPSYYVGFPYFFIMMIFIFLIGIDYLQMKVFTNSYSQMFTKCEDVQVYGYRQNKKMERLLKRVTVLTELLEDKLGIEIEEYE